MFGRAFGQTPEDWMNLQNLYDLETAKDRMGHRLKSVAAVA